MRRALPLASGNRRQRTLALLTLTLLLLAAISVGGRLGAEQALVTDLSRQNLPPSADFIFGTDWLGRDMFLRTLAGLSLSIRIGLLTASVSAIIAFVLGAAAALGGRWLDSCISWLIDLALGVPHLLLLILISYACGKGFWGVVIGVSLTHWPALSRVVRGEVLQLKQAGFVRVASRLGVGPVRLLLGQLGPHLLPQLLVGLVLLFPHAILHEASVTFLGFGLSPEQPAIGVILAESMKYLALGRWWLALLPGLLLVLTVVLFDLAGNSLQALTDPAEAQL